MSTYVKYYKVYDYSTSREFYFKALKKPTKTTIENWITHKLKNEDRTGSGIEITRIKFEDTPL